MTKEEYYVETEGIVTEDWLMREYIETTKQMKQYNIFKKAIAKKVKREYKIEGLKKK